MPAMIKAPSRRTGWLWLVMALGSILAGCGGGTANRRISVTVYPKWNKFRLIERIAVMPFANQTKTNPNAGQIMSDKLAALLAQNGTYKEVLDRSELAKIMGEQALSRFSDFNENTRIPEGLLKAAQVLVVGSVSEFQVVTKTETRVGQRPEYYRDRYGNTMMRTVPYQYPWSSVYATVAATVRVVDTATGTTLWGSDTISSGSIGDEGQSVSITPAEARDKAANIVAKKMLREIAAVQIEIKPRGQVIYTASGYFDGEYQKKDRFTPEDQKIMVVVNLGPNAQDARDNAFKVAIAPAKELRNAAEADLVWTGQSDRQAVEFDLRKVLEAGGGFGAYKAKVYAGPKPFAEFDFSIMEKK